jgi:catechol 2,3-dioxygenase-like lactoylglutathione lyase family enzyme
VAGKELTMFKQAVPILGVSSSVAAERFYTEKLGFRRAYAYRPSPDHLDPCWLGVVRDGAHIVLSSFDSDGPPGTRTVQLYVDDISTVRDELVAAGVLADGEILNQDWGNLEVNIKDVDGNQLNIAQEK